MTIHSQMFDVYAAKYDKPLIWYGVWAGHYDLRMAGYHVWDKDGSWVGVYQSPRRAKLEADRL